MKRFIYTSVLTFVITNACAAPVSEVQMSARAKESLARNSAYEMDSVKAFWGNADFVAECTNENMPLPAPFTIYFEVLPDGRLGDILFSPLTDVGRCFQTHVVGRKFPIPPGGAYVTKIDMSFEKH